MNDSVRSLNKALEEISIGNPQEAENLLSSAIPEVLAEHDRLKALNAEMLEALRPFAEPHKMGDNYVRFAPRLIETARAVIAKAEAEGAI